MSIGKPNTWGGVIDYAVENGASIEVLKDVPFPDGSSCDVQYLERRIGDKVYRYVLPEDNDRDRRVGPRRWMHIFSRLRIREPEWVVEY